MVNTFWRGDTTKVILLQVLVANSLLHFSSVTGDAAKCNTKSSKYNYYPGLFLL